MLRDLPGVLVVGEAGNGLEAIRQVHELKPDLVLMDISLPELDGLATTRRLHDENPELRIVILSMHADKEYAASALQAGARGYLLKDGTRHELELAIRAATSGETYLSPRVARGLVKEYVEGERESPERSLSGLTPRQRQVLRLVAEGCSNKAIAKELGISVKTVESHRSNLMRRLDIRDVAGLVRFAMKTGLVAP